MKTLPFVAALALLALPSLVMAALPIPLVRECTGVGGVCGVCDLVGLGDRVVDFLVYAAGAVGTLLFVYAGILYATSGPNRGNIEKAHRIFWDVLIGFIIVLAAWLIVDVMLKTLANGVTESGEQGLEPWAEIVCIGANDPSRRIGGSAGLDGGGLGVEQDPPSDDGLGTLPDNPVDYGGDTFGGSQPKTAEEKIDLESQRRTTMGDFCPSTSNCVVGTNNDECGFGETYQDHRDANNGQGCTDVSGLNNRAMDSISQQANLCGTYAEQNNQGKCNFIITGGSELGHEGGTNPGTHGGGDKYDLRSDTITDSFVQDSYIELQGGAGFGVRAYCDPQSSTLFVLETGGERHWDVNTNSSLCGS